MVKSRSEQFFEKRSTVPLISASMVKSVSDYRKDELANQVAKGEYREGTSTKKFNSDITPLGYATSSTKKFASSSSSSSGSGGWRGSGGTTAQVPEIYSPLWLNSNFNFPRDRATINAWCRAFYALNPIVRNAISLHSTYPISKLSIKCKDAKIQQFFESMVEEIDLMNICVQIAQEYWVLGESFVYAELDENTRKWSRLTIQNPDYVVVKHSVVAGEPIISLRPDENLKRIVNGDRPSDLQQRQNLDPSIIEHVRRGENIPLSNFHASHIANKIAPYELRGTGLVTSCFRVLMLFDMLRECKFAQASDLVNPIRIIKIGDDNLKPEAADLEAWRDLWESASYDKNFKIFTHQAMSVEVVNSGQGIYDISADITQLLKEQYIGLMVPQVLMDGGGDVTYSNASVTLDVLRQRYMQFRFMLTNWLKTKIFLPIAQINDFYERIDGQKIPVVPDIEWNHMSLFDAGDYIANLLQVRQLNPESPEVSLHTIYRSLGLNFEDENRNLKTEMIEKMIQTKELEELRKYTLTELRTMGPEDSIDERPDRPVVGEELPGEEGGGMDMEGMGGGGFSMPAPAPTPAGGEGVPATEGPAAV